MKPLEIIFLLLAVLLCTSFVSANDLSYGLLHYWNMDENSGTNAADKVGGANLTLSGATWTASGAVGNATAYSGAAQFATTTLQETNIASVNVWFFRNANKVIWCTGAATDGTCMDVLSGTSTISVTQNSTPNKFINTTVVLSSGAWHMVTLTLIPGSGSSLVYEDGTLAGTTVNSIASTAIESVGGATLYVGEKRDGNFQWNGNLDEFGMWNYTLNSSAVSLLWNGGAGCAPGSCVNFVINSAPVIGNLYVLNKTSLPVANVNNVFFQLNGNMSFYAANTTDADNNSVNMTFNVTNSTGGSFLSYNVTIGNTSIPQNITTTKWVPTAYGIYTYNIFVTDGIATTTYNGTINISDSAPTGSFNIYDNNSINVTNTSNVIGVLLDGVSMKGVNQTDSDGDNMTINYLVTNITGSVFVNQNVSALQSSTSTSNVFVPTNLGQYNWTINISDGTYGTTYTGTFNVTNLAPNITAISTTPASCVQGSTCAVVFSMTEDACTLTHTSNITAKDASNLTVLTDTNPTLLSEGANNSCVFTSSGFTPGSTGVFSANVTYKDANGLQSNLTANFTVIAQSGGGGGGGGGGGSSVNVNNGANLSGGPFTIAPSNINTFQLFYRNGSNPVFNNTLTANKIVQSCKVLDIKGDTPVGSITCNVTNNFVLVNFDLSAAQDVFSIAYTGDLTVTSTSNDVVVVPVKVSTFNLWFINRDGSLSLNRLLIDAIALITIIAVLWAMFGPKKSRVRLPR